MEHQPLGVFINKDGAGTFTGFRVPTVNKWTYLLCMLAAGTLASAAGTQTGSCGVADGFMTGRFGLRPPACVCMLYAREAGGVCV